jgi:glycine/D-amino acid oxidase-like deaminating enzyme
MAQKFIVLGGGLAGTMLAARLLYEKQKVTLIDDGQTETASRLAAGMFNILTGKYAKKTWMAEELLQGLTDFFSLSPFSELAQFIHYTPIYRAFKDVADYNQWLGLSADDIFQDTLRFQSAPIFPDQIHNNLGGIFIDKCGWLDIGNFVVALRKLLIEKLGLDYHTAAVTSENIRLYEKKIVLDTTELAFDSLIFCQGAAIAKQDIWAIPLIPNKGQILKIYAPTLELPYIFSGKVYILPTAPHYFTVGATYEWDYDSSSPTEAGYQELCQHLSEIVKVAYQVLSHRAALRPTTHDRRPILGTHPSIPYLHVFSGFGTKGVLLSAFFSKEMADYLLGKIMHVNKECDILRYYKKGRMKI